MEQPPQELYAAIKAKNWECVRQHAYEDPSYAFHRIITAGPFELTEYIFDTYSEIIIANSTARSLQQHFQMLCNNGKLETAKWLLTKFPQIDVHASNERAFRLACFYERWPVINWFLASFPFDIYAHTKSILTMRALTVSIESRWLDTVVVWRLMTYYTADQFWTPVVQQCMRRFLADWLEEVQPRRRAFMAQLAPYLSTLQN